MKKKHLKELVVTKDKFIVIAEFVPLPGNRLGNFEKFLKGYARKKSELPDDVVLAGVTIPQSPSGVASLSPADIYSLLEMKPARGHLGQVPEADAWQHTPSANGR